MQRHLSAFVTGAQHQAALDVPGGDLPQARFARLPCQLGILHRLDWRKGTSGKKEDKKGACRRYFAADRLNHGLNFLITLKSTSLSGVSLSACFQIVSAAARSPVTHRTSPKWAEISAWLRSVTA